jgi:flagellar motor switch protein FliM
MTQTTSKSDQAILDLLTAAKKGGAVDPDPIETTDYDWDVPSRFLPMQLDRLNRFVVKGAKAIADNLGVQLHEEITISADMISQHYAARLDLLEDAAGKFYFPVIRENGKQCGLVVIPGALARRWVGKALGGSEGAEDSDRELSTLESALMRDVVVTVVEALSGEYRAIAGVGFQCGGQVPLDEAMPDVKGEDEYCALTLRIDQEKDQAVISFVLDSDVLMEVASSGITAQSGDNSAENMRENMLACVQQASVTATVSLMTVTLSMREVMNMEIGDVLMSDLRVGEPLELLVGGTLIFSGYPVSCDGQYALQVAK